MSGISAGRAASVVAPVFAQPIGHGAGKVLREVALTRFDWTLGCGMIVLAAWVICRCRRCAFALVQGVDTTHSVLAGLP